MFPRFSTASAALLLGFAGSLYAQDSAALVPKPPARVPDKPTLEGTPLDASQAQDIETTEATAWDPRPKTDLGDARVSISLPFERVYFDEPAEGSLWARGANYKARFGADGMEFTPFLGSDAPRNYPVHFALQSVLADGDELRLKSQGGWTQDGETVSMERGPVTVDYDLDLYGIEQSFWVHERPTGTELELRIQVSSDLSLRSDQDGIRLENERGGVSYGDAFAVLGGDRKAPLETTVDGNVLSIHVPQQVLAEAQFPLRIDPFIQSFGYEVGAETAVAADVAMVGSIANGWVVYETEFSATDHDIWLRYTTYDGFPVGTLETIDVTAANWRDPAIASNGLYDQILVCATVGADGSREIFGRLRWSVESSPLPPFLISTNSTGDKLNPDVGGDSGFILFGYMVVWERVYTEQDHDIHYTTVSGSGGIPLAAPYYVDNSAATSDINPSISKSCGQGPTDWRRWNVTFDRVSDSTDGPRGIYAAQLRWDANMIVPPFLVHESQFLTFNRDPQASPPLDGPSSGIPGPRDFMIVYTVGSLFSDSDIYASIVREGTIVTTKNLSAEIALTASSDLSGENQIHPYVTTDGSLFHVFWSQSYLSSTTDYDLYSATVYHHGETFDVSEPQTLLAGSLLREDNVRVACLHDVGVDGGHSIATFHSYNLSNSNIDGVQAIPDHDWFRFGSYGCAGSPNSTGFAANLRLLGSRTMSDNRVLLDCDSLPAGEFCLFLMSKTAASNPFGNGTICVGAPIVRLNPPLGTGATGAASRMVNVPTIVPGTTVMSGEDWHFQCWYRDQGSFNLSNSMSSTLF